MKENGEMLLAFCVFIFFEGASKRLRSRPFDLLLVLLYGLLLSFLSVLYLFFIFLPSFL